MEQIKVFDSSMRDWIGAINKWLSEEDVEITRALQSEVVFNGEMHITVTVFYKKPKGKPKPTLISGRGTLVG